MEKNWMDNEGARAADGGWHVLPTKPNSKVPGYYERGHWTEMAGWTRFCDMPPSDTDVETWRDWPACGVSIACGSVLGLDLDIEDPKLASQVRAVAARTLGETPLVRYGRKPRAMLVYRLDSPFRSRRVGPLDAMGSGRQFVAFGIHPVTGEPYTWEGPTPSDTSMSALPVIDEAKLASFFDEALPLLPIALRQTALRTSATSPNPRAGELATYDAVASAVSSLPPVATAPHDYWVSIGMAIHSALGGDGMELWDKWSEADARYDGKEIPKRWASFKERGGVSAGTLFHEARRTGWVPEPGLFLYARDLELASAPHPAQALIDRMRAKSISEPTAPALDEPVDDDVPLEVPDPADERPTLPAFVSGGQLPEWLLGCDGGLGMFVNECVGTAVKKQPWLALGGALAVFSAAMGQRYMGPTGVRPNLYVLGVAPSASGKDHPQKWCRELLHSAALHDLLGGAVIASGAGMISALEKHPVQLWVIDEVAGLIKAATEKGASAHMRAVSDNMLSLYSMAGSTYMGTDYADKTTKPRAVIAQPSVHFFGNTTPSAFYGSITPGAARDGLLGRCLLFQSAEIPYPEHHAASLVATTQLIEAIQKVHAGVDGHDLGNLANGGGGKASPKPYMVPWASRDAEELYKSWGILETDRARAINNEDVRALYGRMRENVQKIALIKAVARDVPAGRPPAITWGDMQWASRVFERCMADMEHALVENVAENDYQADRNRLAKIIRGVSERDPRGATKSQIIRACQSVPSRRRDEILEQLEEAGDVRKTISPPSVGRSTTRFVWTFR